MSRHEDTIAALATPEGTAALALIRVAGPAAAGISSQLLGRAPLPREAIHVDYRDRAGILVDDVVATFFPGPRSYTGDDLLEVSCHGSPFIAQKLLEDLFARGCRPAGPGEFTQRAFLNGRLDLSQAEAVMDLIRARSDRALAAAQQQLRGSLTRRVGALAGELLGTLAQVEARIDFPDEDVPPEDRADLLARVARVSDGIAGLAATSRYGDLLRDGMKVVIAGAPNAGKSSLLNRLVGHDRAIVSDEPGTTRDFIEERLTLGSHAVRLVDTAGLNPRPTPLESRGIAKTLERIADADLVLYLLDATAPAPAAPPACIRSSDTFAVWNKTDLLSPGSMPPASSAAPPSRAIAVSAATGAGIPALVAAISDFADRLHPGAADNDLVAINARHAHALAQARAALARATEKPSTDGPAELLAADLREALDFLGEISGRLDNERMLDQLFADFCIGK